MNATQLKQDILSLLKLYRSDTEIDSDYFTNLLESFVVILDGYNDVLTSLVEQEGYIYFQYKCNYCSKVLVEHQGNETVYYPHDINCPVVQAKMLLGGK